MALETDVIAVLQGCCPRVHVGTAPESTTKPYVTWQHVGGESLRYVDNTAAAQRKPDIQVNTWGETPLQAFSLSLDIEEALCAAAGFLAKPHGEPIGAYDDANVASGYLQTFTILGAR